MVSRKPEMKRLTEHNLKRKPEEVFDIIEKLGEGSYGSVFKAIEKDSGMVVAIKQVPLDTGLQEIIQEISIMQKCDSFHVVKYFGSYFRDSELLIVMEFCDGGSVLDVMRHRRKNLEEEEIAVILRDTLKGLQYLHNIRKIHRDIKAGNLLLNTDGSAKLADFGVAGQLTDTMAKRNTLIGTPFWMAPEVIQEIGYDTVADIWSLGITALEMAEGRPPYCEMHPMRAMFHIPAKPAPSFRQGELWSANFTDFLTKCLVKNPDNRSTAVELLQHSFIQNCGPNSIITEMIQKTELIKKARSLEEQEERGVRGGDADGTMMRRQTDDTLRVGTGGATLTQIQTGTGRNKFSTMIINEDEECVSDVTMQRHDTAVINSNDTYVPLFAEQFKQKEDNFFNQTKNINKNNNENMNKNINKNKNENMNKNNNKNINENNNNSENINENININNDINNEDVQKNQPKKKSYQPIRASAAPHPFVESDFDFLRNLSYEELHERMSNLDNEMEEEFEDLRRRYQNKRRPITNAIESKKTRQLDLWPDNQ